MGIFTTKDTKFTKGGCEERGCPRRSPVDWMGPRRLEWSWIRLDCGYRVDVLVEDTLILELKAVEALLPIHEAQLLTYLRLSGKRIGLLINFNVELLKRGIKRMVF